MKSKSNQLLRRIVSTPRSHRGVDELFKLVQSERHPLPEQGDRRDLLLLLESIVGWAEGAATSVQVRVLAEAAEVLASDLGHREGPEEMYLRALSLAPADFSLSDRARRLMHCPFSPEVVERIFARQATLLDVAQMPPAVVAIGFCRLGELRADLTMLDASIQAFERALEIAPNLTALLGLAKQLERRKGPGDLGDAAELYRLAAELSEAEQGKMWLERAKELSSAKNLAREPARALPLPSPAAQVPEASHDPAPSFEVHVDMRDQTLDGPEDHAPPIAISRSRAADSLPARAPNRLRVASAALLLGSLIALSTWVVSRFVGGNQTKTQASSVAAAKAARASEPASTAPAPVEVAVAAATPAPEPMASAVEPAPKQLRMKGKITRIRGGKLQRSSLVRALRKANVEGDHCTRALGQPEKLDALELRFTIDRTGHASAIKAVQPRQARSASFACTRDTLKAVSFPRPRGGPARVEAALELHIRSQGG